jgi:hypothetical protein
VKVKRFLKSRWIPAAAVLVLFSMILGAAYACSSDRMRYMVFGSTPSQQMGAPVTLEKARASSWTFGELPAIELAEPCSGKVSRVTLLEVKAGYRGRLLAVYSHGLWLQFVNKAGPPPQFGAAEKRHVRDVTVHGLPARITSRGQDYKWFWCGSGFSCDDFWTDPSIPGAKWYSMGSFVGWVENGSEISLQGPFEDSVLLSLAEQLRLDTD